MTRVFMKILIVNSAFQRGRQAYMGSEGRWVTNWGLLLERNGHEVNWTQDNDGIQKHQHDIALMAGPEIPSGLNARLKIWMHFSSLTVVGYNHLGLYEPSDSIIVYPIYEQWRYKGLPDNPYKDKTYFMPTPICSEFSEPNFDKNGIAWTDRGGPNNESVYWQAFLKFAKYFKSTLLLYQDFFVNASDRNKLEAEVNSLNPERLGIVPYPELVEKIKTMKFCYSNHLSGLGGSMLEQIAYGAFPLVGVGTSQVVKNVDTLIYQNPYPDTTDEVLKNWELALNPEFYVEGVKKYQAYIEPHLYGNCLRVFEEIVKRYL